MLCVVNGTEHRFTGGKSDLWVLILDVEEYISEKYNTCNKHSYNDSITF